MKSCVEQLVSLKVRSTPNNQPKQEEKYFTVLIIGKTSFFIAFNPQENFYELRVHSATQSANEKKYSRAVKAIKCSIIDFLFKKISHFRGNKN